jgi:hypothetical protein
MNVNDDAFGQYLGLRNNTIVDLASSLIKHITSVSVILIPLLSFVHPDQTDDEVLFRCLLISLSVCILFGVINLYIVLIQHRKLADDVNLELRRNLLEGTEFQAVYGRYTKAVSYSEIICLLSFLSSLVFIVLLSW